MKLAEATLAQVRGAGELVSNWRGQPQMRTGMVHP